MTSAPTTVKPFVFVTCQRGAEPAVKAELSAWRADARPAFQRPGLLTFRLDTAATDSEPVPGVFVRVSGVSLGTARDPDSVAQLASDAGLVGELRLHVYERDLCRPGEEPEGFTYGARPSTLLPALERALTTRGFTLRASNARATVGDRVLHVVLGDANEPMLVGTHVHSRLHHAWPGGRPPVEVPLDAPSRAYGKLEEALWWSGAPVQAGDHAVELGSAPGGASLALVRRGVSVWGVDPGAMDARVLAHVGPGGARCTHVPRIMSQVDRSELPPVLHWVVADVNAAPQVVLGTVERFCGAPRTQLMGVLLTLKLDDWKAARHAPRLVERVRKMGMVDVRATQLAGNRMEFHVTGLTERGKQRANIS